MSETLDEYLWEDELGEAKWTRAFINDLPNSSFAVVEPCADENKAARHLPYRTPDGIDLPHLRNALARMNQVKSVCDGSDESLRAKAKRKLVPLAKKHLPDSKWAKEELVEGQGIQGMDVCGQCKFFEDLSNTTRTAPAVTGAPTDAEVTISSGAIAPGVGLCNVDGAYKGKQDPACTDGRPRERATDLDRVGGVESMNELIMETEINDLKAELLLSKQAETKEIAEHVETQMELTALQDKLARKEKELAVATQIKQRLAQEVPVLRDQLGKAKNDNTRYEVQIDGLEQDVVLYKSEAHRFEEQLDTIKRQQAETKDDILKIRTTLNDEVAKRSEAVSRALSAEESSVRVMKENVDLNEQLVKTHRELTESLQTRADSAKNVIKLQRETVDLKDADKEKTETIRDLKKIIEKLKKKDFDIEISL